MSVKFKPVVVAVSTALPKKADQGNSDRVLVSTPTVKGILTSHNRQGDTR